MVFKNPTVQYSNGTSVWARGFAGQRVQQEDGVLLHTLNQFYGGMIGGDWQAQANLRLGGFVGAGKTRSSIDLNSGESDSDLVFGGVFGHYAWGASFLSVAVQGGHSHTSTTRKSIATSLDLRRRRRAMTVGTSAPRRLMAEESPVLGQADIGNCPTAYPKAHADALPLGIAFSPAFFKPRLTAGIDPA